jgi:hypothetical protein
MEPDGESVNVALSFDTPSHWGGDSEEALSYQLEISKISMAGEHAGSPQHYKCTEPSIEELNLELNTAYRSVLLDVIIDILVENVYY